MIFPVLKTEPIVQVNDKTRLDAESSYITPGEADISLIEIEPEAGAGFIDVTADKYLDWQYATDGDKVVSVRITTDSTPVTGSVTLAIVSKENDHLLSEDADLVGHESDILEYIRDGRSSFLDKHRIARDIILDKLDSAQIWKRDGTRFEAADLIDKQDFKQWSIFKTLQIIFESNSNAIGDIFAEKAKKYSAMAIESKTRATYRLDFNDDGEIDDGEIEQLDVLSGYLLRR